MELPPIRGALGSVVRRALSGRAGVRRVALCGLLLAACESSSPPRERAVVSPGSPEAAARCAEDHLARDAVLARFDGETCPFVLVRGAAPSAVELHSLTEPPTRRAGVAPERCPPERCQWSGVDTPAGPLLLAVAPSPASELPREVWLGAAGEAEALAFTPLWTGEPATVDDTELGPVFALEPQLCGGALALTVRARLPPAGAEPPPPSITAAAGVYRVVDGELARIGPTPAGAACLPIALALP
ncbi:MAG: hypothetical protein R3A51_06940 [Nannocystaceae bacterium]|nr:hypothetical protein [Myxococcales bacterium]